MYFNIEIDPIPKARPRVTRRGTYTPTKTKKAMERVAWLVKNSPECATEPLDEPVSVDMTFYVSMPKSWSKRKKQTMLGQPVAKKRFDIDNLEKLVYDALEGILWTDDGLIWQHSVKKIWSDTGRIEMNVSCGII